MTEKEKLFRTDSWDKAIHSFGKSYIFGERAKFYKNWIRFLTFLGIIVPVLIGAVAAAYGLESSISKLIFKIALPFTILQLIISVIALVNKWSENLSYSIEATNDYGNLSEAFKKLGKNPPEEIRDLEHQFEILETKYTSRTEQDSKYSLKDRELRKGMRSALREFQRKCIGCNTVPLSIKSSNCEVCGNFKKNKLQKLIYHG